MRRADWALLVLAAAGRRKLTPVQLQKTLFLLGRSCPAETGTSFYDFQPYNYGPFDSSTYSDVEMLAREGLAEIAPAAGRSWNEYGCTLAGFLRADEVKREVSPQVADFIDRLIAWAQALSFQQIVRAVYDKFPEMRENSIFQG